MSAQAAQQQQGLSLIPVIDLIHRSECHLDEFRAEIRSGCIDIPHTDLQNFLALCPALSRLEVDVLRPSCEKMTPGTFLCQLLDVLSPANPDQTPIPSPELSYVIVSERWSTLNPERIDALLGRLEARMEVVKDYRARVPVPRWKWDLRFGALPECAPDALEGLKGRIEKLAKSGLKWAIVEPFKLVEPSTSGNDINASSWDYGDSSWDQGDSPHSGWVW
ncbi:hypothetical protein VNI00_016791 [Paramarasmius palmivorus]|uniref:Uncharacterized protein n=1 Tax=Paramarasmius palmivorus TaxID=297713 RepID=A0AAW0BC50_9AGAR